MTPTQDKQDLKASVVEHPFFHGMKSEHRELLGETAVETKFDTGAVIFNEGECAGDFFLIKSGKVALDTHPPGCEPVTVQVIGPGEALGWSWLFPPYVWHFGATAVEPTTLICFSGAHLLAACEENSDLGYELAKRLARIMMLRLQAIRQKLFEARGTPA